MIKKLSLVLAVILVVSCNSTEKKDTGVIYPKKESNNKIDPDLKASKDRGKLVYGDFCVTCHMANGKGVPKAFPPLADSDFLRNNQEESIKGIKNGMTGEIVVNGETYNSVMASLGLSDNEVADVMNYINNSWGNQIDNVVTADEVSKF